MSIIFCDPRGLLIHINFLFRSVSYFLRAHRLVFASLHLITWQMLQLEFHIPGTTPFGHVACIPFGYVTGTKAEPFGTSLITRFSVQRLSLIALSICLPLVVYNLTILLHNLHPQKLCYELNSHDHLYDQKQTKSCPFYQTRILSHAQGDVSRSLTHKSVLGSTGQSFCISFLCHAQAAWRYHVLKKAIHIYDFQQYCILRNTQHFNASDLWP